MVVPVDGNSLGVVLAYLALVGSLMVSYARARAEGVGLQAADVGWFQRPERIIVLGVGLLLTPACRPRCWPCSPCSPC